MDREESAAIETIQVSDIVLARTRSAAKICLFRLVELSSLAVTAEEDVTPRPVPAPSIKLGAKSTRRGFLADAPWVTVPILRAEKSTIARRSTFIGK